jgi:purine-binding chemotaxis protein CheW
MSEGSNGGNGSTVQLLTFKMADREYALNLANVVQIIRLVSQTRAPTPDSVEGMFNLRGKNIPVVDVRKECGLPTRPYASNTPLVIARSNGHVMALPVDDISDVLTLPLVNIEPRASVAPELAHVWAIGKVADRALFILDPNALLSQSG